MLEQRVLLSAVSMPADTQVLSPGLEDHALVVEELTPGAQTDANLALPDPRHDIDQIFEGLHGSSLVLPEPSME
jgi:hypothetical protein